MAGGSETILLVEDSDDVRALAQEQLSAMGYRVLLAASGEEALERQLADRIRSALDRRAPDPRRTVNPIVPAEG